CGRSLRGCRGRGPTPLRSLRALPREATAVTSSQDRFYVTGGTLQIDAPSYLVRQADTVLYEELTSGNLCYVLTARQLGKSSLMIRTAARLRATGFRVAVLDLTALGRNVSAEQWYGGLLSQLGQELNLEGALLEFWAKHPH